MFPDNLHKANILAKHTKRVIIISITALFILDNTLTNNVYADTIKTFPILERLQKQKKTLAKETTKWMKRWYGTNLDAPGFDYEVITGTTSLNLKVRKVDTTSVDGYKAYGSYVTRNDSAHFDAEIAYFNLAAILGHDDIFRPTVRYSLGPRATKAFKSLLLKLSIPTQDTIRLANRTLILKDIAKGLPLKGCLKAKKFDPNADYDAIADLVTRKPKMNNVIIASLQASNAQPVAGKKLELLKGYTGDALQLAREFSIIMTLDGVFEQWDRYSSGNVVLSKDKAGVTHFYATDNGGTEISSEDFLARQSLSYFSRYDRATIQQLKVLYAFLKNPAKGYLGYKDAKAFLVDLGLYSEFSSAVYVKLLTRNLALLLNRVKEVETKYGVKATYLN
jgi:hypothetical protein